MSTWLIGDVHGCMQSLEALMSEVGFSASSDQLIFLGDLVARGPESLKVLKLVKKLHGKGAAQSILGNHDLHLLAVWQGISSYAERDKTKHLLNHKDAGKLMDWLRTLPLGLDLGPDQLAVHAGVPADWSKTQALARAKEVSAVLSAPVNELKAFLEQMHGNTPRVFHEDLTGFERLRVIVNTLTRMRLIDAEGRMDFSYKETANGDYPSHFKPWYCYERLDALCVYFGHWAALEAKVRTQSAQSLDGGCVWGGSLVAQNLDSGERGSVQSHEKRLERNKQDLE